MRAATALAGLLLWLTLPGLQAQLAAAAPQPQVRLLCSDPSPYVGEAVDLLLEITHPDLPRQAGTPRWPALDQVARVGRTQSALLPAAGERSGAWVETARLRIVPLQAGPLRLDGAGLERQGQFSAAPGLSLRVRPLPPVGVPEGFSGFVGDLDMSLTATDGLPDGKALLLTLTGRGPLKAIALPEPRLAPGVTLERIADRHRQLPDGRRQRLISYRRRTTWPGFNQVGFSYAIFQPTTGSYRTLAVSAGHQVWIVLAGYLLTALLAAFGLVALRIRSRRPRTLRELLTVILARPAAGLCRGEIEERLAATQPHLAACLREYWRLCDRRFSPGGEAAAERAVRERELRRLLRKAIDKRGRFSSLSGLVKQPKGPS